MPASKIRHYQQPAESMTGASIGAVIERAAMLWADATTNPMTTRRHDLLRDKVMAITQFFGLIVKAPAEVLPGDVKTWQCKLEAQGLAPATVYARISRLSSFYDWLLREPGLAQQIHHNPVQLARPKAPKAYQTGSSKALDDASLQALIQVMKRKADSGDLVGKRDYALLLFFLLTGMRRCEVLGLRWGDIRIGETILVTARVKGGDYTTAEIVDPSVRKALLDYLQASKRLESMTDTTPLWTRHDHAGRASGALSSHAFAKNLKRYATDAGIGAIHLHQTRHTFARLAGEIAGSLTEVQDALGHKNLATTRVYLQRIAVKRDRFSLALAARLDLD